eukprot:GHVP01047470.1.p1 GENE.GHVP01047470.1~~GHVP01047470.1.p1  ORF type:complete len:421 (+),score=67.00 GHVP01047470.1:1729-2991(+)
MEELIHAKDGLLSYLQKNPNLKTIELFNMMRRVYAATKGSQTSIYINEMFSRILGEYIRKKNDSMNILTDILFEESEDIMESLQNGKVVHLDDEELDIEEHYRWDWTPSPLKGDYKKVSQSVCSDDIISILINMINNHKSKLKYIDELKSILNDKDDKNDETRSTQGQGSNQGLISDISSLFSNNIKERLLNTDIDSLRLRPYDSHNPISLRSSNGYNPQKPSYNCYNIRNPSNPKINKSNNPNTLICNWRDKITMLTNKLGCISFNVEGYIKDFENDRIYYNKKNIKVSTKILSSYLWENYEEMIEIKLPNEIENILNNINKVEKNYHKNTWKKHKWNHYIGGAVIIDLKINNIKKEFVLNPIQVILLYYFNNKNTWNIKELEYYIDRSMLENELNVLIEKGLIINNGDYIYTLATELK